ncbi:MAG: TetR/AcrR family transcriptional regulator [Bacteroidia bacterium]|nr:TetR/AcrR family transcriptional regulator [Bacteroidia bacterium]
MQSKKKTAGAKQTKLSTEQKIIAAAKRVFTIKGYSATRTRDIATEAGINLALLNYYFRSKEKLFELIMFESASRFFLSIKSILNDPSTDLQTKMELLAGHYTDLLIQEPNFPIFILSEIQANPQRLIRELEAIQQLPQSVFMAQLKKELKKNNNKLHPMHFVINLMSLMVFPYVVKPMMMRMFTRDENHFTTLMMERKNYIPIWMNGVLSHSEVKPKKAKKHAQMV